MTDVYLTIILRIIKLNVYIMETKDEKICVKTYDMKNLKFKYAEKLSTSIVLFLYIF